MAMWLSEEEKKKIAERRLKNKIDAGAAPKPSEPEPKLSEPSLEELDGISDGASSLQQTRENVRAFVASNPGSTAREVADSIEHHWHSRYKGCDIRSFILHDVREGRCPGVHADMTKSPPQLLPKAEIQRSSKPKKRTNFSGASNPSSKRAREKNSAMPEPKKNPAAVELGRLGGKKGGPARAAKLSPNRRTEIAKKAAEARWGDPSPELQEARAVRAERSARKTKIYRLTKQLMNAEAKVERFKRKIEELMELRKTLRPKSLETKGEETE